MKLSFTHVLLIVILLAGIVAFFIITRDATSPGAEPTVGATADGQSPTEASDETVCPIATPEFFVVEPVTSPTDQLSQTISVDLGNGEAITITTESGIVTAPFDSFPKAIEIALLPNTTHNLTVEGKVREITQGNCVYGGYTLTTTRDRYGEPLVIEQRQP
ncbi:MAG: hypothetical protein KA586_03240 [Candidatus Promineofilum sp.]|nr:hypothetical protein [Promineifilum sp.]